MRTKNDWTQSAEKDRREIAKRVFDALSAAYPEKYMRWSSRASRLRRLPMKLSLAKNP